MAHAQVILQDNGEQSFCGNWGADGANTCMGLSSQLYKDNTEQDPNHDIYTVIVRVWDPTSDNNQIGDMWLETYTGASGGGAYQPASLDTWQPQVGMAQSQYQITFSYAGISIPLQLPASKTDISYNPNSYSWMYVAWHVHMDCNCPPAPILNPGWAEFAVAFNVPENWYIIHTTIYLHVRFVSPPAGGATMLESGWTPIYGMSIDYPPPAPCCPGGHGH
jgi:hypothetical protein